MSASNDYVSISAKFTGATWLVPASLRVSGMSVDSKASLVSQGFDVIELKGNQYVAKPPQGWKSYVKEYTNSVIAELRDERGYTRFTFKVGRYEGRVEFTQQGRAAEYVYSSQSQNKPDMVLVVMVLSILMLLFSGIGYLAVKNYNAAISEEQALGRFEELAETDDVVIVRHSNNSRISGNPGDVTFELMVDGHPASGRCQSSTFSPMVCRIYLAGDGD